jgi:F-type H+-transporting ATPase subunit a
MTPILPTPVLAAANPVEHVINHPFWVSPDGWWLWSGHMGNLVLTGLIMAIGIPWLASKIDTGPESQGHDRYVTRNKLAHMLEVVCVALRETFIRPLLGSRTNTFAPFLWTLFFFVLINNLLGLLPIGDLLHILVPSWREHEVLPIGGTATQNIYVTGILAIMCFVVFTISGIRQLGLLGYIKHLTAGTPWYLWGLMVPIEIVSTFIKPIALAIRLFANMTAGHILLATLFLFVGLGLAHSLAVGIPVTIASVGFAIFIMMLELLVAFLQAFVFMFLTTVFIAQLSHHDEEHGHDHEHAPAH